MMRYLGAGIVGAALAVLVGAAVLALTSHNESDEIPLPSVISMSVPDARAEIEALGLRVHTLNANPGLIPTHPVVREQIPEAGESVPQNAVVTIKTSADPAKLFGGG